MIAGYRLEEEIGHGGMAVVFRASDERLGRQVALKVLAPAFAADAAFRHRFVRESRAAAVVDDPHIVPIFEAGQSGDALFIAMKLVGGGDVRTLVRRDGLLSSARTAAIISPVASALDAAHSTGLVHRDVKPANMLLDVRPGRPDHVYLADFGLSKRAQSPGLTSAGMLVGTPYYMAPEHIAGGKVDGRTDQYSLACVAFELLSGVLPFEGGNAVAVIHAHAFDQPPPLTSLRPSLPSAADPVLARALAKAPADRYPTCQDFAEALRVALGLRSYAGEPAVRPGQHRAAERAHTLALERDIAGTDRDLAETDKADREQSAPAEEKAADRPAPGRHRRRRRFFFLAIATALLLGAIPGMTHLLSRPSATAPMIPVTGALQDVAAVSATSAWALGGNCVLGCALRLQTVPALIAHWDGASWSDVPSPVRDTRLRGVAAGPAGGIWAAGYSCVAGCGRNSKAPEVDRTLILHWDGRAFSRIPSPSPGRSTRLTSVTAGPDGTAYAVGYYCTSGCGGSSEKDRTLVLHWNHGIWSQVASDSPGRIARLTSVSAASSGVPWAVGYYCEANCGTLAEVHHALTLRPDQAGWSSVPNPGARAQLNGVSVGAGGTAWAVGSDSAGVLIMQWNTRGWHTVHIPGPGPSAALVSVSTAPGGAGWAVGGYCVSDCGNPLLRAVHTIIVRLDARGWHPEASPKFGSTGGLIGVSADSDGTAWAVGYSCVSGCGTLSERDRTLVLRWNGSAWVAG